MRFSDLLQTLPNIIRRHGGDVEIAAIRYDSRRVSSGDLFVAMRGAHVDGHAFIEDAIRRGAAAVVAEEPLEGLTVPWAQVPDTRPALAALSAAFYGYPGRRLRVIGVTGTDGKTTTCAMISHILEAAGLKTGLISTVTFKVAERVWDNDTRQSTPEAPEIQGMLADMVAAGCQAVVIESTSHGLALHRVDGCEYDVAVMTNVTHEHLDFHGTIEAYRLAKARLFEMLGASFDKGFPKTGVVNLDDPNASLFIERSPEQVITYAVESPSALLRARDIVASPSSLLFTLDSPWGEIEVRLALVGAFNVNNALAAMGAAAAVGVSPSVAAEALSSFRSVRGRMEVVDRGQPFSVIVDYAHTPDSFDKIMRTVQPLARGRMIAVFGSAGERDRQKRPLQGEIAARYCQLLVLTDEDPRLEDREAILREIADGAEKAGLRQGEGYVIIPDRAEAIRYAIRSARPGDVVLLLGKGHEGSIIYADGKIPWNERAAAERALAELGYDDE
ncbi:MAG: UDP-N-acetylmuramoyl-L-alanyl-D-glutamate--2,6-diaminopimelate ligase [Anaerolineae bacterium]